MASPIASSPCADILKKYEIHVPIRTTIDKIGGILCHICNSLYPTKKDFDQHYIEHDSGKANIKYTCVVCKKLLSNYGSFRGHCYSKHVVKDKFQCQHCSKPFNKLCLLNSHITAMHDNKCHSCDNKFTSKRALESHKKLIHPKEKSHSNPKEKSHSNPKKNSGPPYECCLCGVIIKTADICARHIDNHCEMLYPCPICKVEHPDRLAAVNHLTEHFDEKIPIDITTEPSNGDDSSIDFLGGILCFYCDILCRNREEIDMHYKDMHSDKQVVYTCNVCRKVCEKYEMFGRHCYDHFTKGKFQCDQCYKQFYRLSLLVIHKEAFHTDGMPNKPFSCELCDHSYMTNARLQEHRRIVHQEETSRSRCMKPGCTAIYDKAQDLIQHMKEHNPKLENWCKQCGLQFTNLSSAEKHLDVHRHTQYSCPICKHTYQEKYLMLKHVVMHFEAVVHICKTCGKAYNKRNRLMEHMKSHSESRIYQCTYCSKSFAKPHQLKQHINTHTGFRPFSCTMCPKTFGGYSNWSKHLRRIHAVDKQKIKQLIAELKTESAAKIQTKITYSPTKTESGIESAGSELSDVYTFGDSDDSADGGSCSRNDDMRGRKSGDLVRGKRVSIADAVKAAIDRIDSLDDNLDLTASKPDDTNITVEYEINSEFTTDTKESDDASDIMAIVEHIEAMSGEMEIDHHMEPSKVAELGDTGAGMLQYADMTLVDNAVFHVVPGEMQATLPEAACPSACLPEYGPDFTGDSLVHLDDLDLPHIDPLLTISTEDSTKMYVQNINYSYDGFTAPIDCAPQTVWALPITPLSKYEDNNDVNNMYIVT